MPEPIRIGTPELRFLRDQHETRGSSSPASGPTVTRYPAPAPNASVAIQAKATL